MESAARAGLKILSSRNVKGNSHVSPPCPGWRISLPTTLTLIFTVGTQPAVSLSHRSLQSAQAFVEYRLGPFAPLKGSGLDRSLGAPQAGRSPVQRQLILNPLAARGQIGVEKDPGGPFLRARRAQAAPR